MSDSSGQSLRSAADGDLSAYEYRLYTDALIFESGGEPVRASTEVRGPRRVRARSEPGRERVRRRVAPRLEPAAGNEDTAEPEGFQADFPFIPDDISSPREDEQLQGHTEYADRRARLESSWWRKRSQFQRDHIASLAVSQDALLCEECGAASVLRCLACRDHKATPLCLACDQSRHPGLTIHERQHSLEGCWLPLQPQQTVRDGMLVQQGILLYSAQAMSVVVSTEAVVLNCTCMWCREAAGLPPPAVLQLPSG